MNESTESNNQGHYEYLHETVHLRDSSPPSSYMVLVLSRQWVLVFWVADATVRNVLVTATTFFFFFGGTFALPPFPSYSRHHHPYCSLLLALAL